MPVSAHTLARLRRGRLARLRRELERLDCGACLLVDPVNVRYATGARNMQVFMLRNPARYLLVTASGPVILFEFEGCRHLAADLETIDEIRPAITVSYVAAAGHRDRRARAWAQEIGSLLRRHGCGRRVAVERFDRLALAALEGQGFFLLDAQAAVERARAIKLPEEIECMEASLRAVEAAVDEMRAEIRPGVSENQLWSHLHRSVIAQDGEYVETRLLSAGPRTNPWFQESSPRPIEASELVALDTDVVGPHGYYADFSRTFFCGRRPSDRQRDLYRTAVDQVRRNIELIRPGMSFRELSERAFPVPGRFVEQRYFVLAHGVGLTGEYPYILHAQDFDRSGYDGIIEPNMTLCVESYLGERGGPDGVKLEEQILVTERGVRVLSRYPLDEELLGTS